MTVPKAEICSIPHMVDPVLLSSVTDKPPEIEVTVTLILTDHVHRLLANTKRITVPVGSGD